MRNWKLISLGVLLTVTFLPVPHALANDGNGLIGVPEPSALLLFASGLAGVMGAAWRRSRRK